MENERLAQLKVLLEESPDDIFVNYAIGLELYKTHTAEEAFEHMRNLANKHPDYCPVHFKLGQWLSESNEDEEALIWLKKALRIAENENDKKAVNEIKEAIWILED